MNKNPYCQCEEPLELRSASSNTPYCEICDKNLKPKVKSCPVCSEKLEDGIVKGMCVNDNCATKPWSHTL